MLRRVVLMVPSVAGWWACLEGLGGEEVMTLVGRAFDIAPFLEFALARHTRFSSRRSQHVEGIEGLKIEACS